jgi:hypothetical protein
VTAAGTVIITEPGVYQLSDADYFADPVSGGSLSSSGARLLLPPSCPALYAHQRDHPPTPKPEYDLGHAAHRLMLGVGPQLVVVEAADWRTKVAREARADAHAAGRVPLLAAQHEQVRGMFTALRQHPIANELLNPDTMAAEQSLFWVDPETGIWRRARLDAMSRPDPDGPPVVVDYKSCRSADIGHIRRAMWDYGYAAQADWYLDGAATLDQTYDGTSFYFVFQEVAPPYLVTVVEPDADALGIGRKRNREAIQIYRDCAEADVWPAHTGPNEIPLVGLPLWVERQHATTEEEYL